MDRPQVKLRNYAEDAKEVVPQRLRQVTSQANPTLLPLLAEQLDVASLIALNRQYPEVMEQPTVLSMLSRRFNIPYRARFEDLMAAQLDLEEERPLPPSSSKELNQAIRRLVQEGYAAEALLMLENYFHLFLPNNTGPLTVMSNVNQASQKLISRSSPEFLSLPVVLEQSALQTGDPVFYRETLELVNEKLRLVGYGEYLLKDRLVELKEYAVQLKNAFYDNDATEYQRTIMKVMLEDYLSLLLLHYPVLVPLSLSADLEIWSKFLMTLRRSKINYRLDYRLLSPKILVGVERSIARVREQGREDLLRLLEEFGFEI